MTVGKTTNSTADTRLRKISTASCALSLGTARSSRKLVSTATSVERRTIGAAVNDAHGMRAMALPLRIGKSVGPSPVFCRENSPLGGGLFQGLSGSARCHALNVRSEPTCVKSFSYPLRSRRRDAKGKPCRNRREWGFTARAPPHGAFAVVPRPSSGTKSRLSTAP